MLRVPTSSNITDPHRRGTSEESALIGEMLKKSN